jgi:hypothetical protein
MGTLTQGVLRLCLGMLTRGSGLLALSSGKSGRYLRQETKTEEKINCKFNEILSILLSSRDRLVK